MEHTGRGDVKHHFFEGFLRLLFLSDHPLSPSLSATVCLQSIRKKRGTWLGTVWRNGEILNLK